MEVTLTVPKYDKYEGVRISWIDGHEIFVSMEDHEVTIHGNPEGLRTLAIQLLTLAQDTMPEGNHIHLSSSSGLDDDSLGLTILRKRTGSEPPA